MSFPFHRFIVAVAVLSFCLSPLVGSSLAFSKKGKASKKVPEVYHPQAGDVLFQALPRVVDLVEVDRRQAETFDGGCANVG